MDEQLGMSAGSLTTITIPRYVLSFLNDVKSLISYRMGRPITHATLIALLALKAEYEVSSNTGMTKDSFEVFLKKKVALALADSPELADDFRPDAYRRVMELLE